MPERMAKPRWLDAPTVERYLPDVERAIELAAFVLDVVGRERGTGDRSFAAAKVSLPPGAAGSFAQAMPARLDAREAPDGRAILGIKWIAGNPANRGGGLPAMGSVVVLNDPDHGLPIAVLDGSPITAMRTAALTGAAIRILVRPEAPPRTALVLGAGVQGHAHLPVLAACGVRRVLVHDRHPERAAALVAKAPPGIVAQAIDEPRKHTREADVVVSCTSTAGGVPWIGPSDIGPDVIVVPVDYDAQVTPTLVVAAGLFAVDDRIAWAENRSRGRLAGWPEPAACLGGIEQARREGSWQRPPGPAVALHQGPGLADVVFGDAVLRALDAGRR